LRLVSEPVFAGDVRNREHLLSPLPSRLPRQRKSNSYF
jgi:hypothetical protein